MIEYQLKDCLTMYELCMVDNPFYFIDDYIFLSKMVICTRNN